MRTFLVNKETGREFEIVGLDKATNQITLRTELATFADVYDKDKFKALGYDLVRREGDTPPIDTPPAPRAAAGRGVAAGKKNVPVATSKHWPFSSAILASCRRSLNSGKSSVS